MLHNIIISLQFRQKRCARLQKTWSKLDRQINDTLPSEQFSTQFGACCVVKQSIVKPTDANKRKFRQKSYEMLFFLLKTAHLMVCQIVHENNL